MQKDIRCISLDVCDYTDKILCNLYDSTADISGQAYEVYVRTQRNGFKELRFKLPSKCFSEEGEENNYRLDYLISDYRIRILVKSDSNTYEKDWFLISEAKITHDFSKNYDVRCSHISQLLRYKNLGLEFSDAEGNNVGTIKEIATTILEGTGWNLGHVEKFLEEDKYISGGEEVEKVRSFSAASKTGAFKMMEDLCDLFDAKPIYRCEEYIDEETGETKTRRCVDIIPMNPFSEDTDPGVIPEKVLEEKKVLGLYYDKNVKNITRTIKTENLVTKLTAYGSYGDLNGMCSLQTAEHAVLTFTNLAADQEYIFTFNLATYWFKTDEAIQEAKWSALDYVSRSYLSYDNKIIKVFKNHEMHDAIEISDYAVEYTKNYFPYLMDFSYYQKVGLLTDKMLEDLAEFQLNMPELYQISEDASMALGDAEYELMQTASDGEGFVRLDIESVGKDNSYITLTLDSTEYPESVIYRSDYDSAQRMHFSWKPAKGIKDNGEALNAIGSVVYIVRKGSPTKWLKSYVKFLGNDDGYYLVDDKNNPYTRSEFDVYNQLVNGDTDTIYVDEKDNKLYVWENKYIEVKASNYDYGVNKFTFPTKIMLWSTDIDFNFNAQKDYVYLFSANSIAGMFGPREDAVESNTESVKKAVQLTSETHPFDILYNNGQTIVPPDTTLAKQNYGWYYVMNYGSESDANYFKFGELYFLWGNYNTTWSHVYVSFNGEVPAISMEYGYYFNVKDKTLWRADMVNSSYEWVRIKDSQDNDNVTNAFKSIINGCIRQETLIKGLAETYTWHGNKIYPGNYAFKNEFNSYWLFTTDFEEGTQDLKYVVKDKIMWQNDDEHYVLKPREYTYDEITFPKANELEGITFSNGRFEDGVFYQEGSQKTSGNIYVYENITYQFSLPSGSIAVFFDSSNRYLSHVTNPTELATPAYTTHIRLCCPSDPTSVHYIRIKNYSKKLFVKDIEYNLLDSTPHGDRNGLPALMDSFIRLADEAYLIKLPELKQAQQNITDATTVLMEELGDMYKEGFWQKNDYVGGDEPKLYSDTLDNLKEISQPEITYEFDYLDLYGANKKGQSIDEFTDDINYPDIDITYAAHLVDMDIDTNCWAYIDTIDKCWDQDWKTKIEINTKLTNMGQQSFTDVLAHIAEVANQVKAKQTIYQRAEAITDSGKLAAERLEGMIQANRLYISGGTSNWYTDSKGNIIFEDTNGESAMMLTGRGLMIACQKDAFGDWEWNNAASGKGINANAIYTGYLSAERIETGSITTDKISATVGSELDITSNTALALLATVDGARPSGSLVTMHPKESDSWIAIGAQNGDQKAYIAVKSGGNIYLESGGLLDIKGSIVNITADSNMNIDSGGSINITSSGQFSIDSTNFYVGKVNGKQIVKVNGEIIADTGNIAGLNIGKELNSDGTVKRHYMYAGDSHTSVSANNQGVYLGTDGINIGGKLKFSADRNTAELYVNADNIHIGDYTGVSTLKEKVDAMDIATGKAQQTANNIKDGTIAVPSVEAGQDGIVIHKDTTNPSSGYISIGSAGKIAMLANSSLTFATSSSNSAFVLDNSGISIGSGADIYIASGGSLTMNSGSTMTFSNTSGNVFKLDGNGVTISSAKQVAIKSGGTFSVSSTNFTVDTSTGTVTIRGKIIADDGNIAGWTIGSTYIGSASTAQSSQVGIASDDYSFWAGNTNNRANASFYVKKDGTFKATNATIEGKITSSDVTVDGGQIGGWYIGNKWLGNASTVEACSVGMANYSGDGSYAFWAGGVTEPTPFYVKKNGSVGAKNLTLNGGQLFLAGGHIESTTGYVQLGNWKFSEDGMYYKASGDLYDFIIKSTSDKFTNSFGIRYYLLHSTFRDSGAIVLTAAGRSSPAAEPPSYKNFTAEIEFSTELSRYGVFKPRDTRTIIQFETANIPHLVGSNREILLHIGWDYSHSLLDDDEWYPGDHVSFWSKNGSSNMELSTNMSNLIIHGTVSGSSSKYVKDNIVNLNDYGTKIDKLEPVSFSYKTDNNKQTHFGLIYEDVIDIIPEICTDNGKEKGIIYPELIPILITEIKSLRARLNKLEER